MSTAFIKGTRLLPLPDWNTMASREGLFASREKGRWTTAEKFFANGGWIMSLIFEPYTHKNVTLPNRIVMSPMCMYSATPNGEVSDWHIVHYGTRAVGRVGLILLEATAVESRGRISDRDLGIWGDHHVEGLKKLVDFAHGQGVKIGIQ